MKLDCVLTAVNENPLYLEFIPIFVKTWNKLYPSVDVKIVLIAKAIPEEYKEYANNIILFEPLEGVLTSFTSQFIRLLYPCILDYKGAVLITDMDILPTNKTYYTEHIKEIDDSKFVYYRGDHCFIYKSIAMCYNAATPEVWRDIFDIHSVEDVRFMLENVSRNNVIEEGIGKTGWFLDQLSLYTKVMEWNKRTGNLICLDEEKTGFNRLSRDTFRMTVELRDELAAGYFVDYHCHRPMSAYSEINNFIYDLLPAGETGEP
jgi:hypothetical protein